MMALRERLVNDYGSIRGGYCGIFSHRSYTND